MSLNIRCDGVTIDVEAEYKKRGFDTLPPTPTMIAWHIRRLADRPDNYSVWLGSRQLANEESVPVTDGMRFDCVPPAHM